MAPSVKISKVVIHTCCPVGLETGQCTDYTWENGSWSPSEPYVWVSKNPATGCRPEPYLYRIWVYLTVVTDDVTMTVHVKVTNDQGNVVLDQTWQTKGNQYYPANLQFTTEDNMPPRDYALTIEAWLEEAPDVKDTLTVTLHPKYPTLVTGWVPFVTVEDTISNHKWFYNRYTGNWYDEQGRVVANPGPIDPGNRVRVTFSSDCFTDLDMSVDLEVVDDSGARLVAASKTVPAGTCGGDPWVVVEFTMPERNYKLTCRGRFRTQYTDYSDETTITLYATVQTYPPPGELAPTPSPTPVQVVTANVVQMLATLITLVVTVFIVIAITRLVA